MNFCKSSLCLLVVILLPHVAFANLVGPYTPDANTLVLLHFDEAAGGSVTTNRGTLGGNFYSVNEATASATPALVTTMLGAPGYVNGPTNFNTCFTNPFVGYEWGYDYNKSGAFQGDVSSSTLSADRLNMSVLNIGNGGNTPFTLEALIQPTQVSSSTGQEVICTDSSATSRAFQFRIINSTLAFQFVTGSQTMSGNIPITGPDAFVAGSWYHVALTYDGTTATLYWTKLDPANGAAHVLSTALLNMPASNGPVQGPLVIGNENRNAASEQFQGKIDEVRISNVARGSGQMQFYSPLVTITLNPVSQNVDYNQPVTFAVGASSQFALGYQWRFNSNSIAGATNTSYVITNVAANNAGFYDCVVTNTIGSTATSSEAQLVVGAANFIANRYSFNTTATDAGSGLTVTPDSIGGQWGTNFGNANVANGALVLDGSSGTFMQLPPNLYNSANATALTFEFWATYGSNPNNVYAFAFGVTNAVIGQIVGFNHAMYCPHNAGGQTASATAGDPQFSQTVSAAGNLDGKTVHVAVVFDPPNKLLSIYTNGVLEAANTNFTVNISSLSDQLSYIGKSLWTTDPYLNASIEELRIFKGALSSISIKQSDDQGPNVVLAGGPAKFVTQPVSLSVPVGQTVTFSASTVGYLPITYQWFKAGALVPGATNASYSFAAVAGDNNATIVCYATNTIGATTYVTNSSVALLTVITPIAPQITWATPAAITYGTPLSSAQLNATANVPGTFVYNPPAGLILNSGLHSLATVFTPADAINYLSVTSTVSLMVVSPPFLCATNNGTITITGYIGNPIILTIPGVIYGYPVVSIGTQAFDACTNLSSVTIPDSVTSLQGHAFAACLSLTNVIIGSNVVSIGDYAFGWCSSLSSLTIPNSVTTIGNGAFYGCPSLASIIIPNSVTNIGAEAFAACASLTSVAIPNSVISIGSSAFYSCGNLASATIGSGVASIGDAPFRACSGLATISVDASNSFYISVADVLFDKSQSRIIQCPALKAGTYAIPATVTNIGVDAFCQCMSLTNITIPGNVSNIGSEAFWACTSLTGAYFSGNSPGFDSTNIFSGDNFATVYYLSGTTGWSNTFCGRPTAFWNTQPVIFHQPTNQTVVLGNNATFSLSVLGTGPFGYQWLFNGASLFDAGNISGSMSNTLALATVSANSAGNYAVIVTNYYGAVTSGIAVLSILLPPAIIQQPNDQATTNGGAVVFSVVATGPEPLVYQWRFNGTPLSGQSGATLTLTNVQLVNSGLYDVVVTNPYGVTTSLSAKLEIGGYSQLLGNWWPTATANSVTFGLTNISPGTFTFGGQNVPANAFEGALPSPVTLAPGESLTFSGYLKDALGLFYPNNFRWGLLNNNGNQLIGPRKQVGDYGNYLGYWGVAPASTELRPIYKLPNSSDWWSVAGVGSVGTPVSAVGSSIDWAHSGVYRFLFYVRRGDAGEIVIHAECHLVAYVGGTPVSGFYDYVNTATDGVPNTYTFTDVGLFAANTSASGFLTFSGLTATYNAKPVINWGTPGAVTYGTALSFTQLDATANVPGTFLYTPPSGTVLTAGTKTISAIFIPADTTNYCSASNSVNLVVAPAQLTVSANDAQRVFGQSDPVLGGVISGLQNGDSISALYNSSAASNSPVGIYAIVPTLLDPSGRLNNYTTFTTNGNLTIMPASPQINWPDPAAIYYGTALSSLQLNANANVAGNFTYNPPAGTILNLGTNVLSAVFTPADSANYLSVTSHVDQVVMFIPFTFTTNNATIAITGYTGPGGVVTIPEIINGLPVTVIDDNAFNNNRDLVNILINTNVTSIGIRAFCNCTSLKNLIIPGSVTNIGIYALMGCSNMTSISVDPLNSVYASTDGVLFDKNQNLLIQYPGGKFGDYTISNSVNVIGIGSFADCTKLTSVIIPNSVTIIEPFAFLRCSSLTNIYIPASVTSIGDMAFGECWNMNRINVAAQNSLYSSLDGVLFDKNHATLIQYPVGLSEDYSIPWGTVSIGDYAFYYASNLTNIIIPDGVASIGQQAFYACQKLHDIFIPSSVNSIGTSTFAACFWLNGMYFNGNAPILGYSVFESDNYATAFYLSGASGWDTTYGGIPTALWNTQPVISLQPTNQSVLAGNSANFSISVLGTGPFNYAWYFNETNLVQNGTNSMLTLPGISADNNGNYTVVVTNLYGSATSQVATLTVTFPPTVVAQSGSQTNLAGSTVNFSVTAGGTGPFTYQWQLNGTNLPNGIITTVAGNGIGAYTGDGGTAMNASLNVPTGVVLDAAGNLYIAEYSNNRIRRVDTKGVITTVAGGNNSGYGGDGGAATNASLNGPISVALDAFGNLYIGDCLNSCIRMVDTNGVITTVAGRNNVGYSGDGGTATNASLFNPNGVAVDPLGNLYIDDQNNQRIRRVSTNGIIITMAGNGSAAFSGDGGVATNASFNSPSGVALDAFGNLYIADQSNHRIRKVTTNGVITTVAGNGSAAFAGDGGVATNASLYYPNCVAFDIFGNLYIADCWNSCIRRVDTNGVISTVAGHNSAGYYGDGGAATNASLYIPYGVALDTFGNLYIAEFGNNRIRKVLLSAGYPALALGNLGASDAGDYSVVITSAYGSVTSAVSTLTVLLPPTITTQPVSQFAVVGSSPSFSVAVTGTSPFNYAWYFNATNLVQSGTNGTLTLPNISTDNNGNYTVVVTNLYGSATSQVATLTATFPPSVVGQSGNQTNLAGSTVNFSVTAGGTGPFSYQWQLNGTNLPCGIITTVAGKSGAGYSGDGAIATNASLYSPQGVVLDDFGNLYIADLSNHRIRKVATNGVISTVAGKSGSGYSGDGGAATNASLYYAAGVAVDAFGNLYIADSSNNRIRMVNTNGIITTVAGNGSAAFAGDGGVATNASLYNPNGVAVDGSGNLYIADFSNNRIRMVDTNGIITTAAGKSSAGYSGDGGAATNASLYSPQGVAVDQFGNLYIADRSNNRIRKVTTDGVITTVAGKSGSGYSGDGGAATNANLYNPYGVTLDAFGNLYIADYGNQRIRKVTTNGVITTVAGNGSGTYAGDGGVATSASLYAPAGVAVDAFGNLYIADKSNNRIRKVLLYSGYPALALGNIGATDAGDYSVAITGPYGSVTSAVSSLTVLVPPAFSTQPASQIAAVGSSPTLSVAVIGTPPFSYAWYFNATNLVQNGTNSSLILPGIDLSNAGNYTVVVTNSYGTATSQVATLSIPPLVLAQSGSQSNLAGSTVSFNVTPGGTGPFSYQWQFNGTNLPYGVITTIAGNGTNKFAGDGGTATNGSLYFPAGVALDAFGSVYIADRSNNRVRKVDTNGMITTVAGNGSATYAGDGGIATNASLYYPSGVALDAIGNLYIADVSNNRIRKVDTNGVITTVAGKSSYGYSGDGGAATNGTLYAPSGVALDAIGNLYIADVSNNRIRKVDTNGVITTVAGKNSSGYSGDGGAATNATLYAPAGVALDALGNLYIADRSNNRVRKVATNGVITTVAGKNGSGYSGDGGAATNASLNSPYGVTLDAIGNVYIADFVNSRVRMVNTAGVITTIAGNGTNKFAGDSGDATSASLYGPQGVALDTFGNLYIADYSNSRIRKVSHYSGYPTLTLGNIGATNAGYYSVAITSPYGSVTSAVATLTVQFPPTITTQPASQFAADGSSPRFTVAVTGTPPFNYAWYFNATSLIQSSTNSTLSLFSISSNYNGNYVVVITNLYGSVTSQVAALTVAYPPTVSTLSGSQTNLAGSTVTFNVMAGGIGPFKYQWQLNGTNLPNNIITTMAGKNAYGYWSGDDGGAATNASLYNPSGVAFDSIGNLYIADRDNHRIRKVNTNGIITTIAGNGTAGYSGDGRPATNASLLFPSRVALDAFGNLYIADQGNNRIRRVDAVGIITTFAGNGVATFAGDGGAATSASLNYPSGINFDSFGNLYIADELNNRIRKVYSNGIMTTVAGRSGSGYTGDGGAATNASLYFPSGVTFDSIGNLYIADRSNNRIRKINTNGIITTIAGNGAAGYSGDRGLATNASLSWPHFIAFDALGNMYFADYNNNRIRSVDTNGIITTVAGKSISGYSGDGGAATNASLSIPVCIAFDVLGNLYIAESASYGSGHIREVHFSGSPTLTLNKLVVNNAGNYSVVITSPYGSVTSSVAPLTVVSPPSITTQPASQLLVNGSTASFSVGVTGTPPYNFTWYFNGTNLLQSDTNTTLTLPVVDSNSSGNYTVVVTNNYGSVASKVATLIVGSPPTVLTQPISQTIPLGSTVNFSTIAGSTGPFAYQWQFNGTNLPNGIITVAGNGSAAFAGDGGAATNASLYYPNGVAMDAFGTMYIADPSSQRIRMVDTNGVITTVAGNGSAAFAGDGGAATNASLYDPSGVALDVFGNLYISDQSNQRIRMVNTNGIITTVAGNGGATFAGDGGAATNASLYSPEDVVVDTFGNLYIVDQSNQRIRMVSTNGIITTVAGNGSAAFAGDGGVATNASLYNPSGVTLDAFGNLYIADQSNHRVRMVNTNGIIITIAGKGIHGYSGDGDAATNASLYNPSGVTLDAFGNLYIADTSNHRIRMVDSTGLISTVAGNGTPAYSGDGGAAANASLYFPAGVSMDAFGNLYIADYSNQRIRKVLLSSGHPTLTLGNIGANNVGNYSVVISSPYGSVTSAVASLAITIATNPPEIIVTGSTFGFLNNQFGFNLNGMMGATIVVDGSTNLVDWMPLFTNTANGNPFYFFDPQSTNFPSRFYRARLP